MVVYMYNMYRCNRPVCVRVCVRACVCVCVRARVCAGGGERERARVYVDER